MALEFGHDPSELNNIHPPTQSPPNTFDQPNPQVFGMVASGGGRWPSKGIIMLILGYRPGYTRHIAIEVSIDYTILAVRKSELHNMMPSI